MLKLALLSLLTTVTLTLLISIALDHYTYLPSISEAGSKTSYRIYSTCGTLSSILLFFGIKDFLSRQENTSKPLTYFTLATAFCMCGCFAFQAVVRIDLTVGNCPHRTAAGLFFLLSYLVAALMIVQDSVKTTGKFVLRSCLGGVIVMMIVLQGKLFEQWDGTNSANKDVMSQEDSYITKFSLIQYCMVGCLFGLLGSVFL